MIEDLNFWLNAIIYFQLITAVIIALNHHKFEAIPVLKYFTFYYWYMVINEIVISDLYLRISEDYNLIVYNVFYTIHFLYTFLLFKYAVKSNTAKKVIQGLIILLFIITIYQTAYLKLNVFTQRVELTHFLGIFSVLILSLYYFYEILNNKKIIRVEQKLMFWVSISYFLNSLVFLPTVITMIDSNFPVAIEVSFFMTIMVGFITNLILIFGFIWSKEG